MRPLRLSASVKLHDAIVNILIYPSLTGQTLLTADTVCLPGNHEIWCVSCVSRLPSTKSVLQNRLFPLTALEPRAPGARRLELVKTFLSVRDHDYPTLPPTDHRPIADLVEVFRPDLVEVVRPDLGRGLPLWGVRPGRAGLRCRGGAEQAVQGGSRGLPLTRPAACRRTRPRGRASPSLLGGVL